MQHPVFSLRMPQTLIDQVDRAAKDLEVSKGALIRLILRRDLKAYQDELNKKYQTFISNNGIIQP